MFIKYHKISQFILHQEWPFSILPSEFCTHFFQWVFHHPIIYSMQWFLCFPSLINLPYYEKRKVSHSGCNHWASQPLIADILLNLSHLLPPPSYLSIENVKFIFPTPNCLFDLSHISNFSCPNVHPNVFHLPSTQST